MVLEAGPRGRGAGGLRQVGPGLRRDRPGHRHRPHGPALAGRGRGRHAGGAGQRRLAGLRPPARAHAQARAARRPATARRCCRTARRCCACWARPTSPASAGSGEQYDHMVMGDTVQRPGGDAAVVRVHGTGRGAGAHHRLHAALLLRRPAAGRHAGGGRGLAQPGRGRRPAAGDHQLPELRQPRAAARSWASSSAASRAWPRPAGRSTSRSCPATSRSTTRPTATRSCPPPMSAAWA